MVCLIFGFRFEGVFSGAFDGVDGEIKGWMYVGG